MYAHHLRPEDLPERAFPAYRGSVFHLFDQGFARIKGRRAGDDAEFLLLIDPQFELERGDVWVRAGSFRRAGIRRNERSNACAGRRKRAACVCWASNPAACGARREIRSFFSTAHKARRPLRPARNR